MFIFTCLKEPKTYTAMNDILQGSVATLFRIGRIFYEYFVTILLLAESAIKEF